MKTLSVWRLCGLALLLFIVLAGFGAKAAQIDGAERVKQVADKLSNAYHNMGWFNGSILVKHQGNTVYHKAFGFADRAAKVKNGLDTKYNLGSIMKHFTQVAVLQLVEQGKLSLDDTIGQFKLGFTDDINNKVTIRHLLMHTGGFGDIFTAQYQSNRMGYDSLDKKLAVLMGQPLMFEPGSKNRYSNYGFVVLGVILQGVSGLSFDQLLQQNILDRLKLKNMAFLPVEGDKNQSLRYSLNYAGQQVFVGITEHPGPDGGMESSVADLDTFYDRLFNSNVLLSAKGIATLKQINNKTDKWRAYGGGVGISSAYELDFTSGYSVTVLSNSDKLVAELISTRIIDFVRKGSHDKVKENANVFAYNLYKSKGLAYFKEHFSAEYTQAGYSGFNGRVINEVGMALSADGHHDQAFDVFNTLIHLYPKAAQAYDSLAWGYAQSGDGKRVQKVFAQALEINPDFSSEYSVDNYASFMVAK
jgi:CubicO group peptidase (beta-lactamase class C family)